MLTHTASYRYALVLSLVLITTQGFAQNTSPIESCFACPNLFDSHECSCKSTDGELSFKACLTFDQTITGSVDSFLNSFPSFFHRDEADRPGRGPDECHGTLEICFNKKLTKAAFRITIRNANKNNRNLNEIPIGAGLYAVKSSDTLTGFSQAIAFLVPNQNGFNCAAADPYFPQCFCTTGMVTNDTIFSGSANPARSIAGLYKLIRTGSVAVIVNGSGRADGSFACDPYKPFYGIGTGTLIRGQLWACNTGCQISNNERLVSCSTQ